MDTGNVSVPAVESAQPVDAQTVQPVEKKYKLKVNGRDMEFPEAEMIKRAQRAEAADERFRLASEKEKKTGDLESFAKALEGGDTNALEKRLGPDKFRKMAEQYLLKYIEHQQLSPEQRRVLELESQIKAREEQDAEAKTAKDKELQEIYGQKAAEDIDRELEETLKALGKKPTPRLVARIAEYMLSTLETKGERMPAKRALERTMADMKSDYAEYFADLPVEEVKAMLPKKTLDDLRRSDIEAVTSQAPSNARRKSTSEPVSKLASRRMSSDEAFKQLERKFGG